MHAAKLKKSDRLQRVYYWLKDAKKQKEYLSTKEIIFLADVCAVNSIISELRANGKKILCVRTGNIWRYRLA